MLIEPDAGQGGVEAVVRVTPSSCHPSIGPPSLQYTNKRKAFNKKRAKNASRRARQAERDRSDADEDAFMDAAGEEETAKLIRDAYGFDL